MAWSKDKRTRQERGYDASYGRARKLAMKRDFYICQPCKRAGRITPATECDHLLPRHKGGGNELANLQAICSECHKEKTAHEAAEAQGRKMILGRRKKARTGLDGWPT